MKKETFVKLIKTCENYRNKCTKLGEAVSKAYVEAGLEKDFAAPYSYEPPYGQLIDELVKAIAVDFADDNYSVGEAEDFINWWIWECDFGKETYIDGNEYNNVNYVPKPMAEVTFGDKTYITKTPSQLYDVIMKHKKFLAYQKA